MLKSSMSPWFATDASRQETPPAAWRPWKGYDRRPWKGYDQPADEVAIDIEGYGELLAEAFSSEPVQTTPSRVEPLSMQKLKLHVSCQKFARTYPSETCGSALESRGP